MNIRMEDVVTRHIDIHLVKVDLLQNRAMDNTGLLLETETNVPRPMTTLTLWNRALQQLDHVDNQRVSSSLIDQRAGLDDLLSAVAEKQKLSIQRHWKYTKRNGEVVPIRDVFQKVVDSLKKFREVGDAVAQYDPAHLSLPWAGIRLLLQLAINDNETYGAMLEGVELMSRFIARYAKVEQLYFHSALAQQRQLEESIVKLYTAILAYLLKAAQYYDEGRAGRMAKNILRGSSNIDKYVQAVKDKAGQVDDIARIIDVDFNRKMAHFMYSGFESLHDKLDGLVDRFDRLPLSERLLFTKPNVERSQILIWLNPVFTDEEYDAALKLQTPGTCQWIFQREVFRKWASPSHDTEGRYQTLWIHGGPGFGKTVLCADIVQRLQNDHPGRVAYFFCTSDDATKRQPQAIVRSWVAQLVQQNLTALEIAEELYYRKDGKPLTTQDVWQLFREVCHRLPDCFMIVDGFDECDKMARSQKFSSHDEGSRFLQDLNNAAAQHSVHILFVSREDSDVRVYFRELSDTFPDQVFEHEISVSDTEADIQKYSASLVYKKLVKKPIELQEEIAEEASRRSQGTFLWVRLLGDRLHNKNARDLREIVKKTPIGLVQQYQRDLQRIQNLVDERDRAIAIVRWILFARRPLTVRELIEAVAIDLEDDSGAFPKGNLPDTWEEHEVNDEIRRLCGSLVELRSVDKDQSPQDHTVHFVHSSVREFLLQLGWFRKDQISDAPLNAEICEDDTLAQICMRCLMYEDFQNDLYVEDYWVRDKMKECEFLRYASEFWFIHAKSSTEWSPDLFDACMKFFEPDAKRWVFWSRICQLEDMMEEEGLTVPSLGLPGVSSLFYASLLGLMYCVRKLLDQGISPSVEQLESTPLHAASAAGHLDVVELLLEHKAMVNAKDKDNRSPLYLAASKQHLDVAKLLLEHEAQVDAKDNEGITPLHLTAVTGNTNLAKILIEEKADVATVCNEGRSPLHFAAASDQLDVARLLIQEKAEVGMRDKKGRTPLYIAGMFDSVNIVRLLLEKKADVDAQQKNGSSPLHVAASAGSFDTAKVLVEEKADVNLMDSEAKSPLHYAVRGGNLDMVKLFIRQKADINAADEAGLSPLHFAVGKGHLEVTKYLLENGAKIDVRDRDGDSPLHLAATSGHLNVAGLLTEKKADPNSLNNRSSSPFHYAAQNGSLDLVRLLVEKNADIDATNEAGLSPLHFAAGNGHIEVTKYLVGKWAKVDVRDRDGELPLHLAVRGGHLDTVKLLIETKAELADMRDKLGRSPFHLAARKDQIDILRFLIETNAELIDSKDADDRSTLHNAARFGHLKVVRLLIEEKADIDLRDGNGYTPLHLAAREGHRDVVKFLIEIKADLAAARDKFGRLPLPLAAEKDQVDVLRSLIEANAELIDSKNADDRSPLHVAARHGHLNVVGLLVEEKANIDLRDKTGYTPLHLAARDGHLDVVKSLVGKADVNARCSDEWTALHFAASGGHLEVVQLLIEKNADVNSKGRDGWSPLHIAAQNGQIGVARILFEKAEVDARNKDGCSPLHLAARHGNTEVVMLLLPLSTGLPSQALSYISSTAQPTIDINSQNKLGITPLIASIVGGHHEVAIFLAVSGADLFLADLYGWNAVDWASTNPLLCRRLREESSSCELLSPFRPSVPLQQTIVAMARRLLDSKECREPLCFNRLGRCLVFHEQLVDAVFCFQQTINGWREANKPIYSAFCDGCARKDDIVGVRYVCKDCADGDLCSTCMQRYLVDGGLDCCKGHSFLEVPVPEKDLASPQSADVISDCAETWLRRLIVDYTQGETV